MLGARCSLEFSRFEVSLHLLELNGIFKTLLKRYYFLMSFNSAHSSSVLLLAFLCWLHCFLTVLAVVAGLFSPPFPSLSLSLSLSACRSMSSTLACLQSNGC